MAVNFTQFSEHTSGLSATVTKAIGATGSAGDWLSVHVVGGADGAGLIAPTITDNISGSTGWELLFSATAGAGAAQIRNTCWRKRCVGGETSVTATFTGNSNKAMTGFLATGVTLMDLYVIDRGVAVWNGTNEVFTIGASKIRANGESYIGQAAVERFGLSFASFLGGATAEGGSSAVESSACGTVAHTNNDGGLTSNALSYGVRPEQAVYVSWLGITTDFGSVAYTDAATVTLTAVESAVEYTEGFVPQQFSPGDTSPASYVRSGRENIITVTTSDFDATFLVQVSDDGETWYDYYTEEGITFNIDTGTARTLPTGVFHFRLKCNGADDGPATCTIGYGGGY